MAGRRDVERAACPEASSSKGYVGGGRKSKGSSLVVGVVVVGKG